MNGIWREAFTYIMRIGLNYVEKTRGIALLSSIRVNKYQGFGTCAHIFKIKNT